MKAFEGGWGWGPIDGVTVGSLVGSNGMSRCCWRRGVGGVVVGEWSWVMGNLRFITIVTCGYFILVVNGKSVSNKKFNNLKA